MDTTKAPDILPSLAAGKHRTPAQGACFMEYASFLAGERWSDRPACTDPVLAELARNVNDTVGDGARQPLTRDVHRVIGLRSDERLSLLIGLRVAATAMPLVRVGRARSLAIGARAMLLALERRGVTEAPAIDAIRAALAASPEAAAEAKWYFDQVGWRPMTLIEVGCTQAIRTAVAGIVETLPRSEGEPILAELLRTAIADAEAHLGRATVAERALVTA